MSTETKPQTVHLNEQANPQGRVLITTQDEDRFGLPCAQAVEACKMHINRKVWFDELDALLVRVRQWGAEHAGRVHAIHAAAREGRVVLFVVPQSDRYDLELGSSLTDLDIELAQQFQVIS